MPPPLRIVSLLPSATEIVYALGLEQFLVGRSHECDYPSCATRVPICSRPNIAVDGSSAEIDHLVKERAAQALSIYDVNERSLAQLEPTHILTQTQCKVCAVSLDDVETALQNITGASPSVISLEPHTLDDLWTSIRRVARACHVPDRAETLIEQRKASLNAIQARASRTETRPRVAAIEWLEPVMTAGNWIPELIAKAGGIPLFGEAGQHSPYLDWSSVVEADPDCLVLFPCGFDIARTRSELHWLTGRSGWETLRAVRSGRVYLCDGHQFFNRPGPRLVESLQALAEMLHPEEFEPALEGTAWQRLG